MHDVSRETSLDRRSPSPALGTTVAAGCQPAQADADTRRATGRLDQDGDATSVHPCVSRDTGANHPAPRPDAGSTYVPSTHGRRMGHRPSAGLCARSDVSHAQDVSRETYSAAGLLRPRWAQWSLSVVSQQNQRQNGVEPPEHRTRTGAPPQHIRSVSTHPGSHHPSRCLLPAYEPDRIYACPLDTLSQDGHRQSAGRAQALRLLSVVSPRRQRQRKMPIERPEAGTRTGTTPRRTHPIREHRRGRAPSTARPAAVLRRTRRARPRLVVAGWVSRQSARVAPPADARHARVFHVKHQSTGRCPRLLWAAVVATSTE